MAQEPQKYDNERRRSADRRAIVSVRMSQEEREALDELARRRGVPVMHILRDAMARELGELTKAG